MRDGRSFLRVKVKSLAAEARIIRHETARASKDIRSDLSHHRRTVVRTAARNTLIAYAFVRGQAYRDVEPKADTQPNWKEVERMVKQYGVLFIERTPDSGYWDRKRVYDAAKAEEAKRFEAWKAEATATVKA